MTIEQSALGDALIALNSGNHAEAERLLRRTIEHDPRHVGALNLIAALLMALGRFEEAETHSAQAVSLDQRSDASFYNYGLILKRLNKPNQALEAFSKALSLNPNVPQSWNNRGTVFNDLKQHESAVADFDKAIALDQRYAEAYSNKGNSLFQLKRFEEAAATYQGALALNPALEYVDGMRVLAKATICDWRDYDADRTRLIRSIDTGVVGCEPFISLSFSDSPDAQSRCARTWAARKSSALPLLETRPRAQQRDKIHIGYLSADLREHPVAQLAAGLFESHDKSRFRTTAISAAADDQSETSRRVRGTFDELINAEQLTDEQAAELIRSKEIDILVDLTGLTGGSRIGISARRPAPIQVSYLGYPGTMGSAQVDYIMADRVVIPPEHRQFYAEKIVTLPHSYQVNDRKRRISERRFSREELGLPSGGFAFCCFNNAFKITPAQFDLWMSMLKRVDGSVLWLLESSEAAASNLKREAELRGLDPARLVFAPRMPLADHLARHRAADLFLDTLPYNAHTTASDALWAGLPVLTQIGNTFAGRVAASLLHAVGMPELIVTSPEQYQALAIELACNPARLSAIKDQLASRRLTAPLFDTGLAVRHIERAYEHMFERFNAGLKPDHIEIAG